MNEDIELDPDELGLIAETVVYKHLRSYYNSEAKLDILK